MNKSALINIILIFFLCLIPQRFIWGAKAEKEMSVHDVFQMIVHHGFYCEIEKGSWLQGEGLRGIKIPNDFVFKSRRSIYVNTDQNGNLNSQSIIVQNQSQPNNIRLTWSLTNKNGSFKTISNFLSKLNRKQKKQNKWRIPTIMELFSILREDTMKHVPAGFRLPWGKSLTFWTSTPVKKVGDFWKGKTAQKAYFVIHCWYMKQSSSYWVSIGFKDAADKKDEALVLPVSSDIIYNYDSGRGGQIPGFEDKQSHQTPPKTQPKKKSQNNIISTTTVDTIPGFDDVNTKTASNIKQNTSMLPRKLKLAVIPCVSAGMVNTSDSILIDHICGLFQKDADDIGKSLARSSNIKLSVQKFDAANKNHLNVINDLYFIMSKTDNRDSVIINQVTQKIIIPEKIDFILTMKYELDDSGIETIKMLFIDGSHKKMYEKIQIQNFKENRYSQLRSMAKNMILDAIDNHFDARNNGG